MKSYLIQTVCDFIAYSSRNHRLNFGGMLVQIAPTQQSIPKVVIKVPKTSTQSKRIVSKAMDIDPKHTPRKKMKSIQKEQYVDLEDEGPKEQTGLDMLKSGTSVIESRVDQFESEGSSEAFHS
jgi:hypothetical protein